MLGRHTSLRNQALIVTLGTFFVSSTLLPTFAALTTGESPYMDQTDGGDFFVSNEVQDESFLYQSGDTFGADGIISSPLANVANGSSMYRSKITEYQVQNGDTVGSIAEKFKISADTLTVNNAIKDNKIKPGQTLELIDVDGIIYEVDADVNLGNLAKEYKVDVAQLASANDLTTEAELKRGEIVIIPGTEQVAQLKKQLEEAAKPVIVEKKVEQAAQPYKKIAAKEVAKKTTASSSPFKKTETTVLATEKGSTLVWPTVGTKQLSQGYKYGHAAIDIVTTKGDHTTAIVAASGGKIIKAQGGWNGGYGNMIVVDHGNGMKTLYAHLREIYVSVGDSVSAGQKIGWMGNTGNVRGRTGLHLHFEVIVKNSKVNPLSYL